MTDEHRALAGLAYEFFSKECEPNEKRWGQQQHVDREVWRKAGSLGLLCASIPEEYGGGGGDFGHEAVIFDAQMKALAPSFGGSVHSAIIAHYINAYGTHDPAQGGAGVSLIVVETTRDGFSRGRNLQKVGQHGQDTCELFFDNVRVPASNLLGEEGKGFQYLMEQLPQERLALSVPAVASVECAVDLTVAYTKEREAFGKPILAFQNTRFELAECSTIASVARSFLDDCIVKHLAGDLTVADAAKAKWWLTEQQNVVADRCLQLFGGYGYVVEYPIARIWADSRIQKIYGGTNEIMKEIIGRFL
nr:acyl-CoA dehydrogenase family protein [Amycolatopsis suaedae]